MAEGPDERRVADEAALEQSGPFARGLGPDWVEVEPGIYRHRTNEVGTPLSATERLEQALEQALQAARLQPDAIEDDAESR